MSKRASPLTPSKAQPSGFYGRLIGHRDGFGFIRPDTGGDDVFVSPKEMLKAMHGDRVSARVVGTDRRGRPEAVILEVVEHANRKLVGRLVNERGILVVVPEDQRIKHDVIVAPADTMGAESGQVVSIEIVDPPPGTRRRWAGWSRYLAGSTTPAWKLRLRYANSMYPMSFLPRRKNSPAVFQTRSVPKT